jgi:Protein of unknown function (DUF3318)
MSSNSELGHLIELMPASGRMLCKVVSDSGQAEVISAKFPRPWQSLRPITINFDLWDALTRPQRDLIFLRTVCWLINVRWFKPDLYQSVAAVGLLSALIEFSQGNAMGVVVASGITGLASYQIWRKSRNAERELEADAAAVQVAQRRGYTATDAAFALMGGIQAIAQIEHRPSLEFSELMRVQHLKTLAGVSTRAMPNLVRKQ